MTRPVTLFTGQWADMPLLEFVEKASSWGFFFTSRAIVPTGDGKP